MGKILRTLLLVLIGLAAAGLATQNSQTVSLRFLVWESVALPVWVFLLVTLAVGIVVGGASLLIDHLRLQQAVRRERRRAEEATRRADDETRRANDEARRADALAREVEGLRGRLGDLAGGTRPVEADETLPDIPGESTTLTRRASAPGDPFE